MLPKIVKKALKHIYKQTPIWYYMPSMQVDVHKVFRGEDSTRFAIYTYGDDSCDFDSRDDLVEWAHDEYHYSHDRLPAWDCSGLVFMRNYRVVDLPKLGNACAVIFYYSVDV